MLLPPNVSGRYASGDGNRVYFMPGAMGLSRARFQALMAYGRLPPGSRGWVYEVTSVGMGDLDPDEPGAYSAEAATVARVIDREVTRWHGMTFDEVCAWGAAHGGSALGERPHWLAAAAVTLRASQGVDPHSAPIAAMLAHVAEWLAEHPGDPRA